MLSAGGGRSKGIARMAVDEISFAEPAVDDGSACAGSGSTVLGWAPPNRRSRRA
jgi:hypothetical protein